MDEGRTDELILFVFDLLYLDGESIATLTLVERKARLAKLFAREAPGLRYSDHVVSGGPHLAKQYAQALCLSVGNNFVLLFVAADSCYAHSLGSELNPIRTVLDEP